MKTVTARSTLVLVDIGEVIAYVDALGFGCSSSEFIGLIQGIVGKHLRALEPTHCLALRAKSVAGAADCSDGESIDSVLAALGVTSRECSSQSQMVSSMAHIATKSMQRGFRPVLLTKQPRLLHLTTQGVEICDPITMRWTTADCILAQYGVPPSKVTDSLALQAANGIGRRIAARLLKEYGDARSALVAAADGVGRESALLRLGQDAILRELQRNAPTDAPIEISPKCMEVSASARSAHERIEQLTTLSSRPAWP